MSASYQEVMKQHQRMCKKVQSKNKSSGNKFQCYMCPLQDNGLCYLYNNICDAAKTTFGKVEEIIMNWAKENPEPEYPTWIEWLEKQGICVSKTKAYRREFGSIEFEPTYYDYVVNGEIAYIVKPCANKPIPADIAERLGLEPKKAGD